MSKLSYVIGFLGLAASLPAWALQVDATCPATVKSNTTLEVPVKITNNTCSAVTISKVVAGLVGNSNSSSANGGTVGVIGPFVKDVPDKIVPKATCKTYPGCVPPIPASYCQYVTKPGSLSMKLIVVAKTPATLNNTLALATTGVMDKAGKVDLGTCYLTVVP